MVESGLTNHEISCCDFGWAAGLFEGEGCITWSTGPVATVSNNDLEVLERFLRIVGIGRIYGPYESDQVEGYTRRPRYRWQAHTFEEVEAVINMLSSWFSTRRRERAREVLTMGRIQRIERLK